MSFSSSSDNTVSRGSGNCRNKNRSKRHTPASIPQQQQQQQWSPWSSSSRSSSSFNHFRRPQQQQQQQHRSTSQQQQQCFYFLPSPANFETTFGGRRRRRQQRGLLDMDDDDDFATEQEQQDNDDDDEEFVDSSLTTNFSSSSDAIPSRPVFQNLVEVLGKNELQQQYYRSGDEQQPQQRGRLFLRGRFRQGRGGHNLLSSLFNNHQRKQQQRISTTHTLGYVKTIIRHGDPVGSLAVSGSRPNTPTPIGKEGDGSQLFPAAIPSRLLQLRTTKHKQHLLFLNPKVPLANERTLLDWFQWAVLLSGFSFALSSFNCPSTEFHHQPIQHQIYGIMLMPLAIVIICHSLMQYARRHHLIHQGSMYDQKGTIAGAGMVSYDACGPIVFGGLFIMVTLLATIFCLQMNDSVP